jgi:hypothetical protein
LKVTKNDSERYPRRRRVEGGGSREKGKGIGERMI